MESFNVTKGHESNYSVMLVIWLLEAYYNARNSRNQVNATAVRNRFQELIQSSTADAISLRVYKHEQQIAPYILLPRNMIWKESTHPMAQKLLQRVKSVWHHLIFMSCFNELIRRNYVRNYAPVAANKSNRLTLCPGSDEYWTQDPYHNDAHALDN